MKKFFLIASILLLLSACSQDEDVDGAGAADETIKLEQVNVPDTIFTSDKENEVIDEEEMKSSIGLYLDSFSELFSASELYEEKLMDEEELSPDELEKLNAIYQLSNENDGNFLQYISKNTLPEGYQEEVMRISSYITGVNEVVGDVTKGNLKSLISNRKKVIGKEQQKIEDFLDEKNIETKAFDS